MDSYRLNRSLEDRQQGLLSTIKKAVQDFGNNSPENKPLFPELIALRDALNDYDHMGAVDNAPVLNFYSTIDRYNDTFTDSNTELLLKAVKIVFPEVTTIQYSLFSGKRSDLYLLSATPEELAQLAQIKEQEEKEYKEQERQEEQQEIKDNLKRSRIPETRWDQYTFKSFNIVDIDKNHSNKEACRLAMQYAGPNETAENNEHAQEGWHHFLTYIGTPGSGKTRLALTIGLYLIRNDWQQVRYWQVQDLFETLKGTFNKSQKHHSSYDGNDHEAEDGYNKILESLKSCETLILDDLGAENGTEWVRSILDMLIDYRYENEKNTIITSNVSDINELSPRIASRLSEGNICKILMPDFRKIKAVQREKKSRKVGK